MPWLDVQCPNEQCPGREVHHPDNCRCGGTGRVPGSDPHEFHDCDEGEVVPARWSAHYVPPSREQPGDFDNTIHCPSCGEEGVDGDE
jgi:hypothetical protein